jgi:methylated-DNA-[protein]-cysteine S-methyltransferase
MIAPSQFLQDSISTPLGKLAILCNADGELHAVGFSDEHPRMERELATLGAQKAKDPGGFSSALRAYFDGNLTALDGLAVAAQGTPFQRSVWTALREIPSGETRSYKDIACRIGKPAAVRAVGLANGRNPVAIIVPCHRVIGSDGSLTGYGGGIERKQWLLRHEGIAF